MMLRRALGIVVALAVVGSSGCALGETPRDSSGRVTASASTDAYSIRVGDCTGDLTSGTVDELGLVPCDTDHAWEAFASTHLAQEEFPGDGQVADAAEEFCTGAFADFVGIEREDSELDVTYLHPTKQSWNQSRDREVLCLVGLGAGGITGTLKNSKR